MAAENKDSFKILWFKFYLLIAFRRFSLFSFEIVIPILYLLIISTISGELLVITGKLEKIYSKNLLGKQRLSFSEPLFK